MFISQVILSSILIITGYLVSKYPNLIAGYNTMSKKEKQKVNIKNLQLFLQWLLVGLGVFSIISYFILEAFGISIERIISINSLIIVVTVIIALVYVNTNKKFKN
ncbi:DUF3784 domain-containing protein [Lacinutrix sp. MedPE-SW]|uniref:DUF3784 domain-containing protein n=1 Tax=Lacinutrix sp. MedPE-SW TaxID=1860087 RepID=UPI000921112E|nr:DUF3784 domain-containing protein [Lacinutrix sp. MedPE-SW]OIQ15625.1 MAG: hypothetical protein BM549_13790 [Lacinutrix sp. MedPE-SW]